MTDDEVLILLKEALDSEAPEHAGIPLRMDTTLGETGIRSITALQIAAYMEEKLNITLPDDELARLNSIGDLVRLIRRQI